MTHSILRAASALIALFIACIGAIAGDVPCGCDSGCKVCREVPDVKKTTRYVYCCKCEDFCAPRILPPCLWHLCGNCACGHVRTKYLLVKKAVVDECPTTKCVVDAPCASGASAKIANPAGAPLPKSAPATFGQPLPY